MMSDQELIIAFCKMHDLNLVMERLDNSGMWVTRIFAAGDSILEFEIGEYDVPLSHDPEEAFKIIMVMSLDMKEWKSQFVRPGTRKPVRSIPFPSSREELQILIDQKGIVLS